MISPAHRAAIGAMVESSRGRTYPSLMIRAIINRWERLGYPRAEVEAIVYKETDHDTSTDRSVEA